MKKYVLVVILFYMLVTVAASPNISIQVREDTLSNSTSNFFLIRNEDYNGSSIDLQLLQEVQNNNTSSIWKTNKTIRSFSYAGTSNFSSKDLGRVCLNVSMNNSILRTRCYPEEEEENTSPERVKETEMEKQEDEGPEESCSPPRITLSESVFSSQIKYVVRGSKYEYWVEDGFGEEVKSKRESDTTSTKKYTPGSSGGYVIRATNTCGEDEAVALVRGERRQPYLKVHSVDVRENKVLADIHLYKDQSSSYAVYVEIKQEGEEKETKTMYVRGDKRDIEVKLPFSTKALDRGEASITVRGFDFEDSLRFYVDKEAGETLKITSLYTRKKIFEPFDLHIHLSDNPQGYIRVTYEDQVIEQKITGEKQEVRVSPTLSDTVFLVELLDVSKIIQDTKGIHVSLENPQVEKQKKPIQEDKSSNKSGNKSEVQEESILLAPHYAYTKNNTPKLEENVEDKTNNTETVFFLGSLSVLTVYLFRRLRG